LIVMKKVCPGSALESSGLNFPWEFRIDWSDFNTAQLTAENHVHCRVFSDVAINELSTMSHDLKPKGLDQLFWFGAPVVPDDDTDPPSLRTGGRNWPISCSCWR